jgi:uncharacterized protein YfaA (DUF2138 family)
VSNSKERTASNKPWWAYRRNRNKVWLGLIVSLVGVAIVTFVWFATQGTSSPKAPEAGRAVQAFQLPDVVSGKTFSLADYLGRKDIVVVSYMGFF